jgi:hypothetical protein
MSRKIRTLAVDRVVEHVVLAKFIFDHDITAGANPVISVGRDGEETAGRKRVERDSILIEEGTGGTERAAN